VIRVRPDAPVDVAPACSGSRWGRAWRRSWGQRRCRGRCGVRGRRTGPTWPSPPRSRSTRRCSTRWTSGRPPGSWTPAAGPGWPCRSRRSTAHRSPGWTRPRDWSRWPAGAVPTPTSGSATWSSSRSPTPRSPPRPRSTGCSTPPIPTPPCGSCAGVLAPGSPLAVLAWGPAERSELRDVLAAIGGLLPPPPPGAGGQFALSAPGALEALVEGAGLRAGATGEVPTPYVYPDVETAVRAQSASGPAVRAAAHAGGRRAARRADRGDAALPARRRGPAGQRVPLRRGVVLSSMVLTRPPRRQRGELAARTDPELAAQRLDVLLDRPG